MKTLQNIDQLTGLIATLERQEETKKDLVASGKDHLFFADGNLIVLDKGKEVVYETTGHFHSQIQEKLGIPSAYYNKMLSSAKPLLDENVNHWLKKEAKNFLVRTFDEPDLKTARAFLSDRYSILDNYQILIEALDAIKQTGIKIEIVNAELSETRMYLNVVCPEVEVEAKELLSRYRLTTETGTGVISGFALKNSEVGKGAFSIMPRAVVLACKNGMITTKDILKNVHLGSRLEDLGFDKNPEVLKRNLGLIRSQIKHAVRLFLSKDYLQKTINVYRELGEQKIEAPVINVIEVIGKKYNIAQERKENILKYFIDGGDTRRIGLASAMTFECQNLADPDAKHETEVASFEMLQDFKNIEAAAFRIKRSVN